MEDRLRSAKAEDADWIRALYKQEQKHIGSFNLYQYWEKYLSGEITTHKYVALGTYAFCHYYYSSRRECYVIQDIAVHESKKGQGIGKYIFNQIVKLAHKRGYHLELKCNASNTDANAFYEKVGMKKRGVHYTVSTGIKQYVWII